MKQNKNKNRGAALILAATLLSLQPGAAFSAHAESDRNFDPEASLYTHQWALDNAGGADINIIPAWDLYAAAPERRQVIVAIIDTGIDISHPDLADAIWVNEDEIPGDGIDNDGNGYIDDVNGWNFYDGNNQLFSGSADTHGTHAAGTISGIWNGKGITGIADSAYVKIMPLKTLGTAEGGGRGSVIAEAIRYAEANGASICNLSFGGDENDAELDALIRSSQMLFTISAGNGDREGHGVNLDEHPVYPAALPYDNIITVASLTPEGALSGSSNYGANTVDIAAPGDYILSTISGHDYGFMGGTSMAAPMVAGVAALISSMRPDLDTAGIRTAILSSARPLEALTGRVATQGIPDAYGAAMWGQ